MRLDDVRQTACFSKVDAGIVPFTVVESRTLLTKTVSVDDSGKPIALGKISLTNGIARRVTLVGTVSKMMEQLADVLSKLDSNKALICAPPPAGRDEWTLVTLDEINGRDDVVARSPGYFKPGDGPALYCTDADIKDYPARIRDKLADRSPLAVLREEFPIFAAAACVSRPSSSAGIRNKENGVVTPTDAGRHDYFIVKNGSDIDAFTLRFADYLVLRGWGWTKVSASGSLLPRTLIDVMASRDASRLFYEADAYLADERLEHVPGVRDPVVQPGGFLDTEALPPLTAEEQVELRKIRASLDAEVEEERQQRYAEWSGEQVEKRIAKGMSEDEARRLVKDVAEARLLDLDHEILLDSGQTVTVREIMAERAAYHKKTCRDPLDPTYDGGARNKAVIYTDGQPRIFSHAHGGITYLLQVDPASTVDELNVHHAVVMQNGKALVLTDRDKIGRPTFSLSKVGDLRPWYDNDPVWLNGKRTSKLDVWRQHPRRRQYAGIEFAPEGVPEGVYNLWRGFAVEPDPSASCERFLSHLRDNIAQGDEGHFNYLVGFMAQMVQQPAIKPGVALAFRGLKGVGKSVVGEYLIRLFHPANRAVLSQPRHLLGNFNAHLQQAVLVQVEEAFWAGDVQSESALKHMITSHTRLVEPKGLDAYEVRDCARFIVTSNSDWVIPASQDERRWAVLDVGTAHQNDREYFGLLVHERDNGGLAALLHHLLQFDLSTIDVGIAPKTVALRDQKLQSLKSDAAFMLACLQKGAIIDREWGGTSEIWPKIIGKSALWETYVDYAKRIRNDRYPTAEAAFAKALRAILPGVTDSRPRESGRRLSAYVLPPLSDCRVAFEKWLGQSIDWEEPHPDHPDRTLATEVVEK